MPRESLPKVTGADVEVGNFILGGIGMRDTCAEASRRLLREIIGHPARTDFASHSSDSQDWGRRFLASNGGCAYIDLNHLELCLPETISAFDHVACWQAMLKIARRALRKANDRLPDGEKIQVIINNSDGLGNSYGSHLNFLVTRRAWDGLFRSKIHPLLYLAAFQISSIVYTGQGKVGSENGAPEVAYQISQRADFFETLIGEQTTYRRPVVNSRDEPLCGRKRAATVTEGDSHQALARLHVIFYDSNLCQVANLLKVGVMQIVLAMIEAERINLDLILDDPLTALRDWSHDPTLEARARLVSGEEVTAVELQLRFFEEALRFVIYDGCEGIVPRADEILTLWKDTLHDLAARNFATLAPRLDWVLKWSILQGVISERPDLGWDSPEIKHLDLIYSSLNDAEGLYWAYERSGFVERVVTGEQIERFRREPPTDTRAWTRAKLLRWASPEIAEIDWDYINFKTSTMGYWPSYRTLHLESPLSFTESAAEPIFGRMDATLDDLLDELGATPEESSYGTARSYQLPLPISTNN